MVSRHELGKLTKFHVYLPLGKILFSIHSVFIVSGEGPSRGPLRDCENRWTVCSSNVLPELVSVTLGDPAPVAVTGLQS